MGNLPAYANALTSSLGRCSLFLVERSLGRINKNPLALASPMSDLEVHA